ncbi:hypothetical protein V1477_020828 [Vespula maculifrons]|uniref:Uncharacterized protein n=1 Tax=Vespula maculifrons TaxID=7453 RepID=A0ABD2AN05_VESMC
MQWLGHEARSGYVLKRPPHIVAQEGNYRLQVIGMSNPSLMACGLIKTPFTLYHVDTYARSSLFLDGDDGPFHLLATVFRTRVRENSQAFAIFSYKDRVTLVKYCVDVRGLQQHCTQECIWIPKHVDF